MNPNLARTLAFRKAQVNTPTYAYALESKERNDCTVVALQVLTGCPYVVAHAAVKRTGRPFRAGLSIAILHPYLELFRELGCTMTQVRQVTLEGQFLVLTTNHAAAVVNGKAVNGLRRDSVITHIFKVDRG